MNYEHEQPTIRPSIIIAVAVLFILLLRNSLEARAPGSHSMLAFMVLGGPLACYSLLSWIWRSVLRA